MRKRGRKSMFCENCGAQLLDGASFCMKCGAKVSAAPDWKQNAPEILFKGAKSIYRVIRTILVTIAILLMLFSYGKITLVVGGIIIALVVIAALMMYIDEKKGKNGKSDGKE